MTVMIKVREFCTLKYFFPFFFSLKIILDLSVENKDDNGIAKNVTVETSNDADVDVSYDDSIQTSNDADMAVNNDSNAKSEQGTEKTSNGAKDKAVKDSGMQDLEISKYFCTFWYFFLLP